MYTCAKCAVTACKKGGGDKLPKNCPMRDEQLLEDSMKIYKQPENEAFYISASEIERLGHFQWVRVKETMMLCRQMGYHRIGLAFCWWPRTVYWPTILRGRCTARMGILGIG